jgi:hypothetical protein
MIIIMIGHPNHIKGRAIRMKARKGASMSCFILNNSRILMT